VCEAGFIFPPLAGTFADRLVVLPTMQRAREDLVKIGPEIEV
jgi:hypothetical protein